MERKLLVAIGALTLLQACASLEKDDADSPAVELRREETSIPFANVRSPVNGWQTDGIEGMWIEDSHGDWYYARFLGPCFGVDRSIRLGFDTGTSDRLDRFSHVIVPEESQRCALASFTASDPPEGQRRRNTGGSDGK
jgi:hypothetical protein